MNANFEHLRRVIDLYLVLYPSRASINDFADFVFEEDVQERHLIVMKSMLDIYHADKSKSPDMIFSEAYNINKFHPSFAKCEETKDRAKVASMESHNNNNLPVYENSIRAEIMSRSNNNNIGFGIPKRDDFINPYHRLTQQEYNCLLNKNLKKDDPISLARLFPEKAVPSDVNYNKWLAATQLQEYSLSLPPSENEKIKDNSEKGNNVNVMIIDEPKKEEVILQEYDIFPKQIMGELYEERNEIPVEINYFFVKKTDYPGDRKDELEKHLLKFAELSKAGSFENTYKRFLEYLSSIQFSDEVLIDYDYEY